MPYLAKTQSRAFDEVADTERWAKRVTWLGLEIVDRVEGGVGDAKGIVEFIARYLEGDRVVALRERSTFSRTAEGAWRYDEGTPESSVTEVPRNAPCPCGSGRKFKQCHA